MILLILSTYSFALTNFQLPMSVKVNLLSLPALYIRFYYTFPFITVTTLYLRVVLYVRWQNCEYRLLASTYLSV